MLKGLTLLELVVAMAIIASLMGIGLVALINYRSSVQLQSAYTDLVTAIKTLQNNANNSTSIVTTDGIGDRVSPDIYVLRFSNNEVTPYYCLIPSGSATVNCSYSYPSSGITSFLDVDNVSVGSNCKGAGFFRLTLDLVSVDNNTFSGSGNYSTTGTCTITLTHRATNDTRTITLDLKQNKADL